MEALKALSEKSDLENTVDVEEVIRYFVVHNFVCNSDSYTGTMIHNYYLYEEDGQLSMIPWDYNLAFGTFQGGDANGTVNSPIDTPVSGGTEDRPMVDWIFSDEEYTQMYHQYFQEFLATVDISGIIDEAYGLIGEYVKKDPTAFCTYEEFETAVETLRGFCTLRSESVSGQLDGTIPATQEGQSADSSGLIDASSLNLSSMGTMSMGGGMGGFGGRGDRGEQPAAEDATGEETATESEMPQMPGGMEFPGGDDHAGEYGDARKYGLFQYDLPDRHRSDGDLRHHTMDPAGCILPDASSGTFGGLQIQTLIP